jgi:hypothetical protein
MALRLDWINEVNLSVVERRADQFATATYSCSIAACSLRRRGAGILGGGLVRAREEAVVWPWQAKMFA